MPSTKSFLTGYREIGRPIGKTPQAARRLDMLGQLPTFRIGGRACSTPALINEWRAAKEAEARSKVASKSDASAASYSEAIERP